jgi:hypothetical protein
MAKIAKPAVRRRGFLKGAAAGAATGATALVAAQVKAQQAAQPPRGAALPSTVQIALSDGYRRADQFDRLSRLFAPVG